MRIGVTGANLKRRIETIMQNRDAYGLNFGRKLLLAVVGILAVAGPVVIWRPEYADHSGSIGPG